MEHVHYVILSLPANFLLVATITLLVGLLTTFHFIFYTETYIAFLMRISRTLLGIKSKQIPRKSGRGIWSYGEKGVKSSKHPTLLFLHGIGGDYNSWHNLLRYFPNGNQYHFVFLDMPGHGFSTFDQVSDEASVEGFVLSIREFIELTGLDRERITVVGTSYGGAVAALFAFDYPHLVEKLVAICPVTRTPEQTPLYQRVFSGDYSVFAPETGKGLMQLLDALANKKVVIPEFIMNGAVKHYFNSERRSLIKTLLKDLAVVQFSKFEQNYAKVQAMKTPTLILWGEDDQIIHVSGAYEIYSHFQDSVAKLVVLKDCNHVVMLDKPLEAAREILHFIDNQTSKDNEK